ncbi:MAG TPA: hypothetical protein VFM18_20685 [Methanosarcina sp.]|nr:hypothetical protein [Methanosarcina sp.]
MNNRQTFHEANTAFWLIVEQAMLREFRIKNSPEFPNFGTEENPAKYGNVHFWRDNQGGWCYDIPTSQWDTAAIVRDLGYFF